MIALSSLPKRIAGPDHGMPYGFQYYGNQFKVPQGLPLCAFPGFDPGPPLCGVLPSHSNALPGVRIQAMNATLVPILVCNRGQCPLSESNRHTRYFEYRGFAYLPKRAKSPPHLSIIERLGEGASANHEGMVCVQTPLAHMIGGLHSIISVCSGWRPAAYSDGAG